MHAYICIHTYIHASIHSHICIHTHRYRRNKQLLCTPTYDVYLYPYRYIPIHACACSYVGAHILCSEGASRCVRASRRNAPAAAGCSSSTSYGPFTRPCYPDFDNSVRIDNELSRFALVGFVIKRRLEGARVVSLSERMPSSGGQAQGFRLMCQGLRLWHVMLFRAVRQ